MMFKTHMAFGLLIGLILVNIIKIPYQLIFVFLVAVFSSLPDIDHPKSRLGRKLFFLSWPINLVFKHRGFFHSIFPPIALFLILSSFGLIFFGLAIAVGYLAHLVGDSITKEGINFLYPFTSFRIRGPIRTGQISEVFIYFIIIILDAFFTAKLFNLI